MNGRSTLLALLALAPFLGGADLLLRRSRVVEQGNDHMKAGKAEEALADYDKALTETPGEPGVHFNRGTALYGLSRWDDAAQAFLRATEARTPDLKASAFYNLGNAFFQGQKYEEAAQAFKKSLAYNPGDLRAKWNLELALRKKKEEDDKKKQQQKDQKDQKNQDPNQKGEQKNADQKQDKGDEQKQDPKDQDQKGDQDPNQQQQSKQDQPQESQDQKKPEQKNPPKPDPKSAQNQKNEQKPEPKPAPEKQAKNNPAGAGKEPPRPTDVSEMEAILDNLERSPKALEQELARLRAMNRRPPAKDW